MECTLVEISINGESIKQARKVKSLGITVDKSITWKEHCKKLKCKIKAALSFLQKLKNILTQSKLDQTLFESHMRYSDKLQGTLSRTKFQHLHHLQNRAK